MTTAFTYLLAVICAGTRSFLTKQNGKDGGVDAQFNLLRAFSALLLFGILSLIFGFQPHTPILLYGAVYGLLFFGSCICGLRALALGPLSITSSIVAFSLVIPCMYGAMFLGEVISVADVGGFVLIAAATLLMNSSQKRKTAAPTASKRVGRDKRDTLNGVFTLNYDCPYGQVMSCEMLRIVMIGFAKLQVSRAIIP